MLTDEQALEAMQHPKVLAAFERTFKQGLDAAAKHTHLTVIDMIECVLVCRAIASDTDVLNGLKTMLANHKARVLAMPDTILDLEKLNAP